VRQIGVQFHAHVGGKPPRQPQAVDGVQQERDLEAEVIRRQRRGRTPQLRGGATDRLVVQAFLNLRVEQGVVRSQCLELRRPQAVGRLDVAGIEP